MSHSVCHTIGAGRVGLAISGGTTGIVAAHH